MGPVALFRILPPFLIFLPRNDVLNIRRIGGRGIVCVMTDYVQEVLQTARSKSEIWILKAKFCDKFSACDLF